MAWGNVIMDRGAAGTSSTSSKYTRSDNDYNRSDDDNAASSRSVQYSHGTVRQSDSPPRTTPRRDEFHRTSGARSFSHLSRRSVKPTESFDDLIKQEKFDELVRRAHRLGDRYDGRNHSQYTCSIKRYASFLNRPLNPDEQSQLIPLLQQNFKPSRSWSWRSLTTTVHSLTSAGVFTPHKLLDESVKHAQAALLPTLLAPITIKCNQKPEAKDIDGQGITNVLWAMAKLVENGQELTPKLKEAVVALLPHVNAQRVQFIPQHVVNLLWAMAKLVDYGQERTPRLTEAVVAQLSQVNALKDQFIPQGIANLLWAIAKLVDNGQERTPVLKEAVAALLLQVKTQKDHFNLQGISNLLWAMAKLLDNGLERTLGLKEALAALLPYVKAQGDQFSPRGVANLLWALAKLVDKGQEQTPALKEAVAALWPRVKVQKDQFTPQGVANLLWALARLVDKGQERTPVLKEAAAALWPRVNENVQKANFIPQEITNLLWAMAKLIDNGLERTPEVNKAVAALLSNVNAQKDQFITLDIANLLWAMAKLVDSGQERTPALKEAVAALLPHVNAQKDQFTAQDIANLLWAMAKLVDNGQELTPALKEAVAAPLQHVNAQKANFSLQEIANLLWAMGKLGELIELNLVQSTLDPLVNVIRESPQILSQKDRLMSLRGVMACCARFFLDSNAKKNDLPEKLMDDLFAHLENKSPESNEEQPTIAMAAIWLGRECPVAPHYLTTTSSTQSIFRRQLQSRIPSLKIEEEKSLNALPPVDLLLPDHKIAIEILGPSHYVGGDFQTRTGSTLLKIALLQRLGFEVIEIPVNKLSNKDSLERVIDQVKTKLNIPP